MLLIGEVSRISQVSLRMLRYYDKNDLFKPQIINEENGYRYYAAEQLDDLYKIVELRDMGFSIAEISELIKVNDEKIYIDAVEKKKSELEDEIKDASLKLKRLEAFKRDVKDDIEDKVQIVLKKLEAVDVISYRKTVKNYYCEGQMWGELMEMLIPVGYDYNSKAFSLYHDLDYREEDVDIELCVEIQKPVNNLPEGLVHRQVIGCEYAASLIIYGPYSNISAAYRKFAFWLERHPEYKMCGANRQIAHVSPYDTDNEEDYVTEILIPLEIR